MAQLPRARRRVACTPGGIFVDGRRYIGVHALIESMRPAPSPSPRQATPYASPALRRLDGQRRSPRGGLAGGLRAGRALDRAVRSEQGNEGRSFRAAVEGALGVRPRALFFQVPVCLQRARCATQLDALAILPSGAAVAVELKRGFHGVWDESGGRALRGALRMLPDSPRGRASAQAAFGALAVKETYGLRTDGALVLRRTDAGWQAVRVSRRLVASVGALLSR